MAVLAQYTPPSDSQYGRSASGFFSGINEGLSIMERKQAMELNQQRADQQRAEFYAKLPLIAAETTSAQVKAKAAVDNAVTTTNLETKAAAESVDAQKELQDALQYNAMENIPAYDGSPESAAFNDQLKKNAVQATYEGRVQRLGELKAKYAYMANLKDAGYQGFYKTINDALVQANDSLHSDMKLQELIGIGKMRQESAAATAAAGVQRETIRAGAKVDAASIYTTSRENIAAINNDAKLTLEERKGKIAAEKTGATISSLQGLRDEALQAAAQANVDGDKIAMEAHLAAANEFSKGITKATSFAADATPTTPITKAPPLAKTPTEAVATSAEQATAAELVPGAKVTPNAPILSPAPGSRPPKETTISKDGKTYSAVEVDGKTYPIVVDKNGKRAYVVDGHAVLLNTP